MHTGAAVFLVVVVLAAVVGIGLLGFWLWTLFDILIRPNQQWEAAGQNKILWLVIVFFLHILGSLLYVFIARPSLTRLTKFEKTNFDPTAFGVPQDGMTYYDGGFRNR